LAGQEYRGFSSESVLLEKLFSWIIILDQNRYKPRKGKLDLAQKLNVLINPSNDNSYLNIIICIFL